MAARSITKVAPGGIHPPRLAVAFAGAKPSRRRYSASRPSLDADKGGGSNSTGGTTKPTPTPASPLAGLQSEAGKWWNRGIDLSGRIASTSASAAERTARQAAGTAGEAASRTAAETRRLAGRAAVAATTAAHDSLQAAGAAAAASTTREALARSAEAVGTEARKACLRSHEAAQRGANRAVESTVRRPLRAASDGVRRASRRLSEAVSSSGTRLVRWAWWWSLAAVAVYAAATALPMALVRYAAERGTSRGGASASAIAPDQANDRAAGDADAAVRRDPPRRWWA